MCFGSFNCDKTETKRKALSVLLLIWQNGDDKYEYFLLFFFFCSAALSVPSNDAAENICKSFIIPSLGLHTNYGIFSEIAIKCNQSTSTALN